jgi:hypothetical protein
MKHSVAFKINDTWHHGEFDDEQGQFVTQTRKQDVGNPKPQARPSPKTVRWLGLEWEGEPWPKRIRARWPIYLKRYRGCGCIKQPKALWSRLVKLFNRGDA